MVLRALSLKKKKVLLSAALAWCVVWTVSDATQATTLRSENSNVSIQMDNDGGTILPFTPLGASNGNAPLAGVNGTSVNYNLEDSLRDDFARRPILASGEGLSLNLGVNDLFILLLRAIDGNGAEVIASFVRRNAFIREALLDDASNLENFVSISQFNATGASFGLPDQDWANFRLIALSNMTASASVWLEGRRWASFHGTAFPLDGVGSLKTDDWGRESQLNLSSNVASQSGLGPSSNKQYFGTQSRTRGSSNSKTHEPIWTTTLKEFFLKLLTKILRSPMFYIVVAVIILLIASRQLMRARRS
ncbi:MAG: hypothetical protein ACKVKG_13870 [Alphaproteobacteria bacterium]